MLNNNKNAEREKGMRLLPRTAAAVLAALVVTVGASAAEVPEEASVVLAVCWLAQ